MCLFYFIGQKNNLLPSTTVVDNYPLKFLDDLAIDDKEGVIYLTQPSTKWDLSMFVISVIEHESSGRSEYIVFVLFNWESLAFFA